MTRTISQIQQEFGKNSGYRNEIIWDLLSENQGCILKEKIRKLIPNQEDEQKRIEDQRAILYEKVWAQRKYTNRSSLSTIIYVLVTKEKELHLVQEAKEFSCHPVFRTRKCVAKGDSSDCCMIFIDETGRVYQNWKEYLSGNVLPKGTMVVPRGGVYTFDDLGVVNLDVFKTPASSVTNQVLAGADTGSTIAGFLSACVPIAVVLAVPVAAPVIMGAAVVGLASAGYSTIRSGSNLVDRNQHDQSIGLEDRHARNNWLGVVGGVVGFGASGATRAITTVVKVAPEISATTEAVLKSIKVSSIVLSSTGVANGILDLILKYNDDEDISVLDWLKLSASLMVFTHSITNFRLASAIVNSARNGTIQAYCSELSKRQQSMFNEFFKKTERIRSDTCEKIDIIRSVNDIPPKQYLNELYQDSKDIRAACDETGDFILVAATKALALFPNESSVATNTYAEGCTTKLCFAQPELLAVSDLTATCGGMDEHEFRNNKFAHATMDIGDGQRIELDEFSSRIFEHIINEESFEDVIVGIVEFCGIESFRFLMLLTQAFIDTRLDEVHAVLKVCISTESILYFMMTYCLQTYSNCLCEHLEKDAGDIVAAVNQHFLSMNPNNDPNKQTKCKQCSGNFNICEL